MRRSDLAAIPGTGWRVWKWALLRSAGFAADGLERFSAPECARAADTLLDGPAGSAAAFAAVFDAAFERAITDTAKLVHDIASDPSFRMAVTWQNPGALVAKNDTVGFFGPVCWVRLDPHAPPVVERPGVRLTTGHTVFFERWALAAFAETLSVDPRVRPSLPVAVEPHLTLVDRVWCIRSAACSRCHGRRRGCWRAARAVVARPRSRPS